MRAPAIVLSTAVAIGVVGAAGCGGSDAPVATTTAGGSGGGPSSVAAAPSRITPEAQRVLDAYPETPVCGPGGLPANTQRATCQFFWNHMLVWQKGTDLKTGPVLVGAKPGSMVYLGYADGGTATPWWGPALPGGCAGTGSIERNGTYCAYAQPGLEFGKSTNIEARSTVPEAKSVVSWSLRPGDVSFGPEHFMVSSTGGQGGTQYAFCGARAASTNSPATQGWVSCSRANPERDGAGINTATASPDARPAAAFGWVIETYPVLVRVTNLLPDTRMMFPAAGTGDGAEHSADASMWGTAGGRERRLDGPRNTSTGSGPAGAEASWWVAAYRKRTGVDATVSVGSSISRVVASGTAPRRPGSNFRYTADLTELAKGAGAQPVPVACLSRGAPRGRCLIRFTPGGVSSPAVVEVTVVPPAAGQG